MKNEIFCRYWTLDDVDGIFGVLSDEDDYVPNDIRIVSFRSKEEATEATISLVKKNLSIIVTGCKHFTNRLYAADPQGIVVKETLLNNGSQRIKHDKQEVRKTWRFNVDRAVINIESPKKSGTIYDVSITVPIEEKTIIVSKVKDHVVVNGKRFSRTDKVEETSDWMPCAPGTSYLISAHTSIHRSVSVTAGFAFTHNQKAITWYEKGDQLSANFQYKHS